MSNLQTPSRILHIPSNSFLFLKVFRSFDHQWSFLRDFHVSPFNDRNGTYTVSIRAPFPHRNSGVALPLIRVRLHTPTGPLKLSASLRGEYAGLFRTQTVFAALVAYPSILFLTLPRILFQASVLHYRRRLDVYKRPELKPVRWTAAPPSTGVTAPGGGIGWQHPTLLERTAQRIVSEFLGRRADALGVCITLQPGDPSAQVQHFDPHRDLADGAGGATRSLIISYLSPRFFTLLVLAGNAQTALRRGGEVAGDVREFVVSDEALFREVFNAGATGGATWSTRLLRLLPWPEDEHGHQSGAESDRHPHPLAQDGRMGQAGFGVLLCALVAMEWAEELLWRIARVRWAVKDSTSSRNLL